MIAIDIDGTLGDYHRHFQWFAEMFTGRKLGSVDGHTFDYLIDFDMYLGMAKHEYREAKLAYRQGGMKRCMPLEPYAKPPLLTAREMGAEIWLTTSRPWQSLDNIDRDTKEWLRRAQIPYDYLIFGDDKYHQLVERVDRDRIVAVVDDMPHEIDTAYNLGLLPMHYAARCKMKSMADVYRAPDHYTVHSFVKDRIYRWHSTMETHATH